MSKVWSNYVSIGPKKISNVGHNSKFCSWKLSRSSSECLGLPPNLKVQMT